MIKGRIYASFLFCYKNRKFLSLFSPIYIYLLIYTFKQNKNEVNKMPIGYNANQVNLSQPSQNTQPFSSQIVNQNVQPLFPQPTGNVYNINSTLEVANVPVGAGISVALCLPEIELIGQMVSNHVWTHYGSNRWNLL